MFREEDYVATAVAVEGVASSTVYVGMAMGYISDHLPPKT